MSRSDTLGLFPGQASQYVGMGKDLYDAHADVRALYDFASEQVGEDLAEISFNGPAERLKQTKFTQPAILTHSLAAWSLLSDADRGEFTLCAGHSLGEYGALVAVGALNVHDAIRLVAKRAALMEIASQEKPGTMAAVMGMSFEDISTLCENCSTSNTVVVPANLNSVAQIVISGDVSAVKTAVELAPERGAKRALLLEVGGAFHSPLMQSAHDGMAEALKDVTINVPTKTFIPNVTAKAESDPIRIKELLVKQTTAPVRWADTMEEINNLGLDAGIDTIIEIGPGKVLSGLAKRAIKSQRMVSLDRLEDIQSFANAGAVS